MYITAIPDRIITVGVARRIPDIRMIIPAGISENMNALMTEA